MNFNNLPNQQQIDLHKQLKTYANVVGGVNPLLTIIEEIRDEKPKALLNKTAIYHSSKAKFSWDKAIYKENLSLIYSAMINEEKNGNIFAKLNPNDYKKIMNMIRTIKPIKISMNSKENGETLCFDILDTSVEKNTKFTFLFKIFFFYNVDFAKEVLNLKIKNIDE